MTETKGHVVTAMDSDNPDAFTPYTSSDSSIAEFSLKALVTGTILGIIFGAANAYLGLKVGITVSASIPVAVMAVAIFRVFGGSTILENNMVQTIGSAGESLAAGVIFTIPALILWGINPEISKIFTISLTGGWLGVFFMIPLRRYLIVKEHGKLKFPEGTACAEVLIAGQSGGKQARMVFSGLGVGAAYEFLMNGFGLWRDKPFWNIPGFAGARIDGEITPPLLGVGYIIGPRISAMMLAGGAISWLVLIPLITAIGEHTTTPLFPATDLISNMGPSDIWNNYIRYIGAGSVAFGGIITLIRSIPTIWESFRMGFGEIVQGFKNEDRKKKRTDLEIPMLWVLLGTLVLIVSMWALPQVPVSFVGAVLIAIFAFFFVTVSSRIVGLIGSSSNPVSGMTIATLLGTSLIFVAMGWTGEEYMVMALSIGAVVCIAAAIAGDTSQDLKTGYLVGATPRKQQYGEFVGVITSAAFIGWTIMFLHSAYQIGSENLSAPQATLMSLVVKGVLTSELPWGLVLIGVFLAATLEILGVHSLPCAVGIYLPISLSTPIMAGGLIRYYYTRRDRQEEEVGADYGTLFSSGLIAGGALMGIIIAGLIVYNNGIIIQKIMFGNEWMGGWSNIISVLIFCLLSLTLIRAAGKAD